jgi:hypothetical protein
MKLSPALLGVVAAGSMMVIGCGPGLTRQSKSPDAVFHAMDKELSHTIGTTELTSGLLDVSQLPEDRMPMSRLDSLYELAEPPAPVLQTWGVSPAQVEPSIDHLLDTRD